MVGVVGKEKKEKRKGRGKEEKKDITIRRSTKFDAEPAVSGLFGFAIKPHETHSSLPETEDATRPLMRIVHGGVV